MATTAEIEAAIAKAEAKGRKDLADQLRARLSEATDAPSAVPDAARVEAAIAKAEAAGRKDLADQLRSKMPQSVDPVAQGPATPPRADAEAPEAKDARLVAAFEAANPALAGRYKTFAELPRVGDAVIGQGGGGRSGGARVTVQPWQNVKADTFGETAGAMMEGPVAGMKAFGGGIIGSSPSPSREFLANDPLTKGLPGPVLTGLGKIGDIGGAALSTVGAGLAGATGLAVEAVPGQGAAAEKALGNDLMGMSMMAVPELAGASSIPLRVASAAPKVASAEKAALAVEGLAAADRIGIPVMRTDIKPPQSFIGKVAQKTGESIPLAGTGGLRVKQNTARIQAAQNFAREYGADGLAPAIDDVAAGLLEKRAAELGKYTKQKREVIDELSDKGSVPVPKAIAAIDAQIEKLRKQKMSGLDPVIAKLEEFKTAIKDQKMTEIEANRAVIGEAFSGLDMGAIRGVGEKALSAVYGPLREDMATFIKAVGGTSALNKWGSANAKLSEMAGELGNTALKRALSKGEATPETVRTLLFSNKPSDVRLLYQNLNDTGRASARTAVVQEALAKAGGIENLSPDKFKAALAKLGSQIGVFFRGDDLEAATGLVQALKLTERGAVAGVTPPTGIQALPAIMGLGLGGTLGLAPAVLTGGGIGMVARIYERAGVKSALRGLSQAKTPKAQGSALQTLNKALLDAGIPVENAAAQSSAAPDYESLWKRYGG